MSLLDPARNRPALAALALCLGGAAASAGAPSFTASQVDIPKGPQRIEAHDLDGDGDLDLVVLVLGRRETTLGVLLNAGDGSFTAGWSALLPKAQGGASADLDLADLDGDGDTDLFVHVSGVASEARLNAGDGSFDTVVPFGSAAELVQVALGTIDGDALPDLAGAALDPDPVVAGWQGQGGGGFAAGPSVAAAPGDVVVRVGLGDMNGDGLPDLVRAGNFGIDWSAGLAGPGFPGFAAPTLAWFDSSVDMELAHLDGDAFLDAVVTLPQSNAIEVFHGSAGGGLSGPSPFFGGFQPGPLAVGDLDGDGIPEVIVASKAKPVLTLLPGGPGGIYIDFPFELKGARRVTDLLAADLDGDGDIDLAATLHRGTVLLLLNTLVP